MECTTAVEDLLRAYSDVLRLNPVMNLSEQKKAMSGFRNLSTNVATIKDLFFKISDDLRAIDSAGLCDDNGELLQFGPSWSDYHQVSFGEQLLH